MIQNKPPITGILLAWRAASVGGTVLKSRLPGHFPAEGREPGLRQNSHREIIRKEPRRPEKFGMFKVEGKWCSTKGAGMETLNRLTQYRKENIICHGVGKKKKKVKTSLALQNNFVWL